MLRLLLFVFVGFIAYKLFHNILRNTVSGGGKEESKAESARGKNMVKDPTCGAYIEPSAGVSVRDGDAVHYFCCYECRDAFLEKMREKGRNKTEV